MLTLTKPRLLFLQNGTRPTSVSGLEQRFERAGFEVVSSWCYAGAFPDDPAAFDACFLSGSPHGAYEDIPWIHREHDLIVTLAEAEVPMLGICFGSQILASALCGRVEVFRRTTCEVGYRALDLSPAAASDPLTEGLGGAVEMFVWHNDEVRAGHDEMVILASSGDCPNHIWRHRTVPAWGIQGHPEVDAAQARAWFDMVRDRLESDGAEVGCTQGRSRRRLGRQADARQLHPPRRRRSDERQRGGVGRGERWRVPPGSGRRSTPPVRPGCRRN